MLLMAELFLFSKKSIMFGLILQKFNLRIKIRMIDLEQALLLKTISYSLE